MAKRIQISRHGGPEVMQWVDCDIPVPAADEVLIENRAIGVNYIDTYIRSGLYPARLPCGIGSEAAGVVVTVGSEVTEFKPGDRVVYAQSSLGAYSEYHTVAADRLAALPDNISFEQAAAVFMKGLTVHYLLCETYAVQAGERFLFHAAAGGVGIIACQWANALGAKLIGTAGSRVKVERAQAAGAWAVINYREEDIAQRLLALTDGEKVRVVYDSVGKATWEASLNCLQPRGLMVSFGNASGPVTGVDLALLNQKGSLYVTRPSLKDYVTSRETLATASKQLFSLMASGAIEVKIPEQQHFSLKDAVQAHQLLESRQTQGSCLLIP